MTPLSNVTLSTAVDTVPNTSTPLPRGLVGQSPHVPPSTIRNSNSVDIHFDTNLANVSQVVEHGTLKQFRKHSFFLLFEAQPWWILGLHLHLVESIDIVRFDSFSSLYAHLSTYPHQLDLFNKAFLRIGLRRIRFTHILSSMPSDAIVLISGSISFYQMSIDNPALNTNQMLYVYDNHYPKRALPVCSRTLQRIKYWEVGGATGFVGLIGYQTTSLKPEVSAIRRVARHYLDFSQRPRCFRSFPTQPDFLQDTQRIPVHMIHSYIHHHSGFVASGSGLRLLTAHELATIFGLPSVFHESVSTSSFPVVPVQILDAALRPILSTSAQPLPRSIMLTLPELPPFTGTHVPGVGTLPLSWSLVEPSR